MPDLVRRYTRDLLTVLAVLVFFVIPFVVSLYGEFLWFQSLMYESVFLQVLTYRAALFLVFGAVAASVLYGSYRWTIHNVAKHQSVDVGRWPAYLIGAVTLFFALSFSHAWPVILQFLNAAPFQATDPVFSQNVAFYTFMLPFYQLVLQYLFAILVLSALLSLGIYALYFGYREYDEFVELVMGAGTGSQQGFSVAAYVEELQTYAYTHLTTLAGVFLLTVAGLLYLSRFDLLLQQGRGTVYGIGYTTALIGLPALTLLSVAAAVGGILVLANRWLRVPRMITLVFVALIGISILAQVAGFVAQGYAVNPDEFNKEQPFLEREINYTRQAFALDRVDEQQFAVSQKLDQNTLMGNQETIENVRLWDWRPLLTTYNELQIFRTYYTFTDVDVDRYMINGEQREVMVSPREIDVDALPPRSRSWVNRHLVYTHGFGVAMSPVRGVTGEGLPDFYIKDIPPNSSAGIDLSQPRIYYGENTDDYTIVDTGTRELDYPSGEQNVYTSYNGSGGVPLNTVRKAVYMSMFGDPQILFSDSITDESRIQFHRDIRERVNTVAPFLTLDQDPYIVVADGKLYWIMDAYTTTDNYPYSRPIRFHGEPTNYVRNSVKVVVDAYTGETTFYVAEDEPLIRTWRSIFPSLFKDVSQMPAALQEHVRYPEDAFQAQSLVYLDYHMTDPQVFYNKEDTWRVPNEVTHGEQVQMEPYYIIMKLPGTTEAEFVQILPFIPRGKENMIGWLAARSSPEHYGNLTAFLFSKQQLVFGPMQIESRIDQDTTISQDITLWSQSGSSVFRGNLLAIPIGDTIMYVEPLFLQSRGAGSLPELKRVIVAHGDQLTMQPTLEDALNVLFGDQPEQPSPTRPGAPAPPVLQQAQTLYQQAQDALRAGDFTTYSQRIEELGTLLNQNNTTQP